MKHCEAKMSTCIKSSSLFLLLMLFGCLLPFAFIFVMFLLFDLIQILICHLFLFIRPLKTVLSVCFAGRHEIFMMLQAFAIVPTDFNSQFKSRGKIINIRLKWLTLCFVSLCSFSFSFSSIYLDVAHGCRSTVVRSTIHIHCTISLNEYGKIVNALIIFS